MRRRLTALLTALLLALFAGFTLAEGTDHTPMLDFTLRDQYGVTHSLADYQGKVMLLNFWTTWCPWCIREMPDLEALYHDLGENAGDVVILGVANPSGADTADEAGIIAFLEEQGLTYPCLMDTEGLLFRELIMSGYPTTWLVRADGCLMGYVEGAMSREAFEDVIGQTLTASGLAAPEEE